LLQVLRNTVTRSLKSRHQRAPGHSAATHHSTTGGRCASRRSRAAPWPVTSILPTTRGVGCSPRRWRDARGRRGGTRRLHESRWWTLRTGLRRTVASTPSAAVMWLRTHADRPTRPSSARGAWKCTWTTCRSTTGRFTVDRQGPPLL